MKKRIFLLPFVLVLFCVPVFAQSSYYADLQLNVDERGMISIKGPTNHPLLGEQQTMEFTSTKDKYTLINISTTERFENYIYEITLPKGSEINYIKTSTVSRIISGESPGIVGYGDNTPFELIIQYHIPEEKAGFHYLLAVGILIGIGGAAYYILKKRESKELKTLKKTYSMLPERQQDIIKLLLKKGKALSQQEIADNLELPKSSVSRNIESLVKQELVKKQQTGMSNKIALISAK